MDFWISDWISEFQLGFLDFTVDFWISVWISADGVQDFFHDGPLRFLDFSIVESSLFILGFFVWTPSIIAPSLKLIAKFLPTFAEPDSWCCTVSR